MAERGEDGGMKALIVVDLLNEFIHGDDEQRLIREKDKKEFISKCKEVIDLAHKKNIPVIYSNLALTKDNLLLNVTGECAMKGTEGAKIIPELNVLGKDHIAEKGGYDGFWKSDLEKLLKKLSVKEVYLIGTQTDCCVRETGVTAAHLGFDVFVIEDCCKTKTDVRQKTAIEFFESAVGKVVKLKDVNW